MATMRWPDTHDEVLKDEGVVMTLAFYAPEKDGTFTAFFQKVGEGGHIYGLRRGMTQAEAEKYVADEKARLQ